MTAKDLQEYVADDESLADTNFSEIISAWSGSAEDRMLYSDFERGVKPYSGPRVRSNGYEPNFGHSAGYGSRGMGFGSNYPPLRVSDEDQREA